jgi:hypothetical protein
MSDVIIDRRRDRYRSVCFRVRQGKCEVELCQNCVTYPLNPRANTVSYEEMSPRIDVA